MYLNLTEHASATKSDVTSMLLFHDKGSYALANFVDGYTDIISLIDSVKPSKPLISQDVLFHLMWCRFHQPITLPPAHYATVSQLRYRQSITLPSANYAPVSPLRYHHRMNYVHSTAASKMIFNATIDSEITIVIIQVKRDSSVNKIPTQSLRLNREVLI